MIGHQKFKTMLVCPGELSLSDRLRLDRHLASCLDCRELWTAYEENRRRLRSLGRLRPPDELRSAVVNATDDSRAAISLYAPFVLALLVIPLSLIAVGVVLAYGITGALAAAGGLALFSALTARHVEGIERAVREPVARADDKLPVGQFLRHVAVDLFGVILGLLIFLSAVTLLAFVSDHLR